METLMRWGTRGMDHRKAQRFLPGGGWRIEKGLTNQRK
jgi:hypothetical protein